MIRGAREPLHTEPLHVAQVGLFNDPRRRTPTELLEAWPTLVDVAEAARCAGARVSVVQACAHSEQLERNGVRYYFLPFGAETGPAALTPGAELLRTLDADVLHVHGLSFFPQVQSLARQLPDHPIILQDHASRPPRLWRRMAWRRGLAVAAGVAFCAAPQARPFIAAKLFGAQTRLYEIPESTSHFTPGDREAARRATGIHGDPAVLWVGHLDANKDPLTVLEGISAASAVLPGLRLWCCFGVAPLLRAVEERIDRDARLRERVQLLGQVPHQDVEKLMRAADLFVLGSHREGSGYALIEALACGLPPVVTDIPSFRALTGGGAAGSLWPCGDAAALSAALQSIAVQLSGAGRAAVRAHFERELSFVALGTKLVTMYRDVCARTRSARGTGLVAGAVAR
jgi:glycosyltransferase involved in cell wall biosynthesis